MEVRINHYSESYSEPYHQKELCRIADTGFVSIFGLVEFVQYLPNLLVVNVSTLPERIDYDGLYHVHIHNESKSVPVLPKTLFPDRQPLARIVWTKENHEKHIAKP